MVPVQLQLDIAHACFEHDRFHSSKSGRLRAVGANTEGSLGQEVVDEDKDEGRASQLRVGPFSPSATRFPRTRSLPLSITVLIIESGTDAFTHPNNVQIDVFSHASHRPAGRLGLSNRYAPDFFCLMTLINQPPTFPPHSG